MADELPVDVLTELGRVTWAAIKLEDYVGGVCSRIRPANPREDRRQIGQKVKDARGVLASWSPSEISATADAWLVAARDAIERRNAILHATPMAWVEGQGEQRSVTLFLGEMPRGDRPYSERPLTVDSLRDLKVTLESAAAGWREVVLGVADERKRQAPQPPVLG